MDNKKNKFFLQGLYDMASSVDEETGLNKFDEQKLRRELEKNQDPNFMAQNKDIFAKGEPKFFTCKWYEPCPICNKCKVKASHLNVRCQNCEIPNCVHSAKDIAIMIKRKNFIQKITHPVFKKAFINLKAK